MGTTVLVKYGCFKRRIVSIDLAAIGTSIGFGGIAGFLIGYAIKKVMKLMLLIVGLFVAALGYLSYQNIIAINWDKLAGKTSEITAGIGDTANQVTGAANDITSTLVNFGIPLTGSFIPAFVFGFMKG